MRSVLLVIAVGCGAAPHGPPHASVRLASFDEFPAQLRHDDRGLPRWADCDLEGPQDRTLYQPLLDYARTELLHEDTRAGLRSTGLDIHWEGEPPRNYTAGVIDRIELEPRRVVGQLSIGQTEWHDGRASWGMNTDYCVHVVDENGGTVFVLVPGYEVIGSAAPTRSFRAAST